MRKTCLLFIFSLSIIASSYAQHKGDYNWMFGYNYTTALEGSEGTIINFNNKPPSVDYQPIFPAQALGNSVSVMSHPKSGGLLFYSNGCVVFDANHELMLNGNDINPGLYLDYYCDETFSQWYPIQGTLLSMEDAYQPDKYYFLHTPKQWPKNGGSYCDRLMYSYIDMTKNEELGELVVKNEIYYQTDEELQCAYTAVVRHANGKDWWVLHPENKSNRFLTFLIDSLGPNLVSVQEIGEKIMRQGASKFSPDVNTLGLFTDLYGYFQYDFDRTTGILSNPKHILLQESGGGGGLSYSPSSEFVYLFYADKIFQLETQIEDLNEEVVLVDTLVLYGDGLSASFSHGQLGPDCKIYITHRSGVNYLGVINNPDKKGQECNLEQRGLDLAYFHDILSIPNFPPFRVDEDDKCDDTISSLFPTLIRPKQTYFAYYPNPVEDVMKVLPRVDGRYTITDASGGLVRDGEFEADTEQILDMGDMAPRVYFINMIMNRVMVQSEKLVKI
ncbi:MAG: hypothetical protein ACI86M_002673 [Saprospiraceae bacterium]|jgi:hypothetical protein